ncbi:MlaE family ABC transporter permease [Flavilitoribacter nigricans]|uniref:ABC transporter permease n=1 Tax=Flavilitoribacter nigricans (strain ATCC 23147 / DSM 23189 / NBRC 102662 / NCIMB 1420 / SS-2) TaxID=1122177 RepID=A0A2D0NB39_FLAN2|nr:ABC transporter permease [Flavilitoribacter nigricans]PHN05705.1 ABC transporter permease [Flavilitoribacter nigricans DSM 23189 = NBRC 102662]
MKQEVAYWRSTRNVFREIGEVSLFAGRFFREVWRPPYEFREFVRQSYLIGYQSLPLVGVTGFIMGLVLTLQTRPTMVNFGAEGLMPSMVGIAIIREIGPVITALICAGKIGSGMGAELGSMKVTEQIAAMEVSGTNPFKYLVVTRILASVVMLPLLVIIADSIGLVGSSLVEYVKGDVSFRLYFTKVFDSLQFGDLLPATIKSFFFGFAIGLVGCYKGYHSRKGTAGVGRAANAAVVVTSMLLFIIDFIAVLVADIFYKL